MSVGNVCYCCKDIFHGEYIRVPGPSLGSIVVDRIVCQCCAEEHVSHMENNFWRGAEHSGNDKCAKCGTGITIQNSRIAHRVMNCKDNPMTVNLCIDCHKSYGACCSAMEAKRGK